MNDNTTFEKCSRYAVNWEEIIQSNSPMTVNESWPREPCLDGYEYDLSEVKSSIVIDVSICIPIEYEILSSEYYYFKYIIISYL